MARKNRALRALFPLVFFGLAAAAAAPCVPIEGGAVEVSWVVRSQDGRAITDCGCAEPRIDGVRLLLSKISDGDGGGGQAPPLTFDFECGRQTGATPFRIPEGTYAVSLQALDAAATPLAAVMAPAPILRDVIHGRPTEIEALPLVAQCASRCTGSNKSGVCTRQ